MTPRKQPTKATALRPSVPLPLAETRRQIWEAAADLIASGDARDISAVLARRFQTTQATISRVMVMEALRYEREAAALRHGVRNALQLARDAGASVYEDSEPEVRTG
jgi:hypothetical protein